MKGAHLKNESLEENQLKKATLISTCKVPSDGNLASNAFNSFFTFRF
jgi:hypothetical protein